jgi:hypothetical protein
MDAMRSVAETEPADDEVPNRGLFVIWLCAMSYGKS